MNVPLYRQLQKFKDQYWIDYATYKTECSKSDYLIFLKNKYNLEIQDCEEKISTFKNDIELLSEELQKHDGYQRANEFSIKKELFFQSDFFKNEYPELRKKREQLSQKRMAKDNDIQNEEYNISHYKIIVGFITRKLNKIIENEPQNISQINTVEEPPLTDKQVEKIGLFVRSGIVSFLREKNPKLNNSQIAKFIRELTSEQLENSEAIRPHLTTDADSVKHPFYSKDSLKSYDLVLDKYGISPQSDS